MVKCDVFFEVRNEFLNTIQTIFGFKWLKLLVVSCVVLLWDKEADIYDDAPAAYITSLFSGSVSE
jgi:hypothetical protein